MTSVLPSAGDAVVAAPPRSLLALVLEFGEARQITLPVFSDVALKVQKAARTGIYDPADIERAIDSDPALVAEVLRVANSAFFAGLAEVASIKAAILRLGLPRVANLVFLASEKSRYTAATPHISALMTTLWRHSSACALAAEWLARKARYPQFGETVFIGALIHDIGKLFLLRVLDEMMADSASHAVSPALIVEVLERAHPEVGHRLLASWNLPDVYRTIVRDHHADESDPSNIPLQIVRLANHACRKVGASLRPDPSIALDALPEVTVLGLNDIAIAELEILLEDIESRSAER